MQSVVYSPLSILDSHHFLIRYEFSVQVRLGGDDVGGEKSLSADFRRWAQILRADSGVLVQVRLGRVDVEGKRTYPLRF